VNGPLFAFLCRRHRLSVGLACCLPLVLGVILGLVYPTLHRERSLVQAFGTFLRGLGQGQIDLLTARGGFTLCFQHPLILLDMAVVAAIPATALPAGERGRGALDLLCATPLTRGRVVGTTAAFAAGAAGLLGVAGLAGAGLAAALAGVVGEVPWGVYAALALDAAALASCLGAGALLLSVVAPDRGAASLWYGVAAAVAFVLDVTARLCRDGEWVAWLTPYGWLRPAAAVADGGGAGVALRDAAVLAGLAAAQLAAAVVVATRRRDA
jgi:hypothetical protein